MNDDSRPGLLLSRAVRQRMLAAATRAAPREACGVLIGDRQADGTRVHSVRAAGNRAVAQNRFDLDPLDLLAADAAAQRSAGEIVGIWHSHPSGAAVPSAADVHGVWSGWLQVIVGLGGPRVELRAWRRHGSDLVEVGVDVTA